ncbi:MAG: class I SAM-dependent methyltransferase [Alphaproteobacteria bacterium]|nr:class I SAM-dependent methyltransferase [Alphaproteobacteria bacterium]
MGLSGSLSFTIDRCRLCESPAIESILDLGRQSLANSLRRDLAEELPALPLEMCRCQNCGTIQLTETVAPDVLFKEYVWVTGTSDAARRYSHVFCQQLAARCRPGRLSVVEVASNDGTFLRRFAERGDRVLGVDPARNIAKIAQRDGVPTLAEFFGVKVAREIVARDGEADAVFARNVIPHVADANDVVAGMAHCLRQDGTGAIEFHRADVILEELHYDSVYHEHLFYHSLHSLDRLLERFGLIPYDVTRSPISGGSLVVYFSKTRHATTAGYDAMIARECELGIACPEPWRDFGERCRWHRDALKRLVDDTVAAGKRVIGYGASARSSTLLNFCGIDARHLEVVADRAPLKHNKYTPGTNIPIVSPDRAFALNPDVVLLLGWNFREEILGQIRGEYRWHGDVIIPLPGPPSVVAV